MLNPVRRIEDALLAHDLVEAVQVVAGEHGLSARVVPAVAADAPDVRESYLDSWRSIFEHTHEKVGGTGGLASDAAFLGWDDSFSGGAIPLDQMREWVDTTVRRIVALAPRRVLEIGAGTGLLLRPIVESTAVEKYVATDFSEPVVEMLRGLARELGPRVEVVHAEALHAAVGTYDTVVVNSVVQYFPSLRYLEQVIENALAVVRPGGHVFLGDLRSDALHEAFCALKTRSRGTGDVAQEIREDGELSVDPAWGRWLLRRFPQLTAVEAAPRRGSSVNEMTLFRFDLVLHVGCPTEAPIADWRPGTTATLSDVDSRLSAEDAPFGYRGVGNARLVDALTAAGPVLDPESLCGLAEHHGWLPRLSWSAGGTDGLFDISFSPKAGVGTHFRFADPVTTGQEDGTGRVVAMFAPRFAATLAAALLDEVRERFPDGQPLADVVFVRDLADEIVGARGFTAEERHTATPVRDSVLDAVLAAFGRHVRAEVVGAEESFFALGGASLPAAMCVRELKRDGMDISLRDLFECQTARALAERVSQRGAR
jgi:SAM-dependent methyltransferase